jgi:CheY-like chemotaxis protein
MPELLLIEDDDDLREDLAAILGHHGFTVRTAPDGRAALDLLRASATRPSVILLDLMMPTMDGWAFRKAQLADPALADIPVVVLTGVPEQAHDLDAQHVFRKPVKVPALLKLLKGPAITRGS